MHSAKKRHLQEMQSAKQPFSTAEAIWIRVARSPVSQHFQCSVLQSVGFARTHSHRFNTYASRIHHPRPSPSRQSPQQRELASYSVKQYMRSSFPSPWYDYQVKRLCHLMNSKRVDQNAAARLEPIDCETWHQLQLPPGNSIISSANARIGLPRT